MLGNITKNYIEKFENKQTLNKENMDWKRYLNDYPDLRKAGIDNLDGAWNHYTDYGIKEKRTAYNAEARGSGFPLGPSGFT